MRTGRNQPCPCGSGRKYKKCCIGTPVEPEKSEPQRWRPDGPEITTTTRKPRRGGPIIPHLEAMLASLQAGSDRRLHEHREQEFLRSEFERLGKTDEQIDKILGR